MKWIEERNIFFAMRKFRRMVKKQVLTKAKSKKAEPKSHKMKEEKTKVDIYCILFSSCIYVLCLFVSLSLLLLLEVLLNTKFFYDNKITTTINSATILQLTWTWPASVYSMVQLVSTLWCDVVACFCYLLRSISISFCLMNIHHCGLNPTYTHRPHKQTNEKKTKNIENRVNYRHSSNNNNNNHTTVTM